MTKFVAECGSNHNGSFDRAKQIIDMAKECGVWGVKFQYFRAKQLYHPSSGKDFEQLSNMELPVQWIPDLSKYARKKGLAFGMTFFHRGIVNQFDSSLFDFLKISSLDTDRWALIREALICTDKRLIISTGLMTISEIKVLNDKIAEWKQQLAIPHKELTFLHCVTQYPAQNAYMNFMLRMVKERLPVGYSDHTCNWENIICAVGLGAEYIEVHIDLDGKGLENVGHCWGKELLTVIINTANDIDMSDKVITQKMLMDKADPEDGMRPLKEYR